jgi:hypothetical protein
MQENFSDILKQGLDIIAGEKYSKPFSELQKTYQSKVFIEFYLKEILCYQQTLDEDEADLGLLCGGRNDLNCDFVIKCDDTFLIFQAKYLGKDRTLDRDTISGFFNIHTRIIDAKYLEENGNEYLRESLSDFTKRSRVHYFLLTSAKATQENDNEFKKLRKEYEAQYNANNNISWELLDFSGIRHNYNLAQSVDADLPQSVELPIDEITSQISGKSNWAFLDLTGLVAPNSPYQTFVCTIKGTTLKSMYQQYKGKLFNYNIRGYLGANAINRKMEKTIEETPEQFYYFNNGLSAICTEVELIKTHDGHGQRIRCKDFQIINGAQTTTCIGTFKNDDKLQQVRVLVRITKAEDLKKERKGLNRKIVQFNNSQSVIKISDFRSNDDIQLFLEEKLGEKYFRASSPIKRLAYMRKRQKSRKRPDEIPINMDTLAKAVYAFEFGPSDFLQRAPCLFDGDTENGGKYFIVFGHNGEESSVLPPDRIEEIAAICFLWLALESKIKAKQKMLVLANKRDSTEYLTTLSKWHFLWAYGQILRTLYPDKLKWVFKKIVDGTLLNGDENLVANWFEEVESRVAECIDEATGSPDEKTGKGFNYKNWVRNAKAFEKFKLKFKRATTKLFSLNTAK